MSLKHKTSWLHPKRQPQGLGKNEQMDLVYHRQPYRNVRPLTSVELKDRLSFGPVLEPLPKTA